MFWRLINKLMTEPCDKHSFVISHVEDVGSYNYIYQYTLTCEKCKCKKNIKHSVLKLLINSNIEDFKNIEYDSYSEMFRNKENYI